MRTFRGSESKRGSRGSEPMISFRESEPMAGSRGFGPMRGFREDLQQWEA